MLPLVGAVLIASLIGSLHCAGMCGVFVAMACGIERGDPKEHARLQAGYHGGRLIGYTILGAIAGQLGYALDLGTSAAGLGAVAAYLASGTMLVIAIGLGLKAFGRSLPHAPTPAGAKKLFAAGMGRVKDARPRVRALTIGLLTALLPCGWLYAFALVAAGTASPLWGAAVMAGFWLGTVPVLASLGFGVRAAHSRFGPKLRGAAALAMVALAALTFVRASDVDMSSVRESVAGQGSVEPASMVDRAAEADCPLCIKDEG